MDLSDREASHTAAEKRQKEDSNFLKSFGDVLGTSHVTQAGLTPAVKALNDALKKVLKGKSFVYFKVLNLDDFDLIDE